MNEVITVKSKLKNRRKVIKSWKFGVQQINIDKKS